MPNIPQPQRQDEPVVTDADLADLLAGTTDAAPGLRPVADVLAALTAEPTGMELAGEARALAEFRRRAGAQAPAQRARRGTGLRSRLGVKVGASVTAVAVVLGGGAVAAFADVLPAPIQRLAHEAIGAPIPHPRHDLPSRSRTAAHGRSGVHGQPGAHGKPAARGGPGANRQASPHATATPTGHGNPQGQGKHGKGKGKGQDGQGNGQGQGNSQGKGNSQGQKGKGPHGPAQQGNAPKKGPHGNSQANRRPAGHPRRSARTGPVMDP
jgi:hypothetical protein